ncbi:MAG: SPFH domain-containing protein [Pseudomonadota bacterium]
MIDITENFASFLPSVLAIAAIAFVAFVVITIIRAVRTVPQGEEWTVERFGRYSRTLEPGLRFMVPLIDQVGRQINMMETVLDIDGQDVITRDNAQVRADAVAFYQVTDAARAAYEVRDLELSLINLAMTNIRSVIGAMDLDDVLSNRDMINTKLLQIIDEAATPWGVKVTRVEIKDLSPPQDIVLAMGSQMKAEREKRAEVLTAEGEKQAAILKAEGQKESQIREAEGRREAAFLDAEAREREAEAEAKATQMVSAAISQGDVQAINYFVAQKYTEALGAMVQSPNAKTIILPIEASGIAGAVSGIAELTGALRGGGGGGTTGGGGSGGGQPGAESGGASQGGASRAAPAASSGPSMSLGPWRQNG